MPNEMTEHFCYWDSYFGELHRDNDPNFPSVIYGFDSETGQATGLTRGVIPSKGAVYGYVACGAVMVNGKRVDAEHFFSTANGATIDMLASAGPTRVVAVQRLGWLGMSVIGGPIEERGRLRYIDTCSDTCLIQPIMRGDPCSNHLHFPRGIDQSEHTHPSTRVGMIARGQGYCTTPGGKYSLHPGRIFHIPTDGRHRFDTMGDKSMDIWTYHPDSTTGPTHEDHIMVNRTIVGGEKIDNTRPQDMGALTVDTRVNF